VLAVLLTVYARRAARGAARDVIGQQRARDVIAGTVEPTRHWQTDFRAGQTTELVRAELCVKTTSQLITTL